VARSSRRGRVSVARLFCFGLGFTGLAVARRLIAAGWSAAGTCRTAEKAAALVQEGIAAHVFTGDEAMADAEHALAGTTLMVGSIAPGRSGDPALAHHRDDIVAAAASLERIVYLSTTAVYGDHGGRLIDEDVPVAPGSERARRRVDAESAWRRLADQASVPLDILRLSGIYGAGRSQIENLRAGRARRIVKPGQVFNRIHVEDIARVVEALADAGLAGAVYNLADDEPAPPQDVVAYAARLIGVEPPPEKAFADADMSEMARSFYGECKRVSNARLKRRLGVKLAYPTYREGLAAIAGRGTDRAG